MTSAKGVLSLAILSVVVACGGAMRGASDEALAKARTASPQGASVYRAECAGCHGNRGEGSPGAPAVFGAGALRGGEHGFRTAADVFAYTKAEMPLPRRRAGTLSDEQYWAVVTHLLVASGVDVPARGLSADNAARVTLTP
jgi:mono/diheme cytochrome c family protein